jgi:biopolymer transport protein ExbB
MELIGIISSGINLIAQANQDTGALNWLSQKYSDGGFFMHPILGSLIVGLAFSFERLWTLSRASVNTKQFIVRVKKALEEGGLESAKELCSSTRGPVASVFYAGLLRADEGLDAAEKWVSWKED